MGNLYVSNLSWEFPLAFLEEAHMVEEELKVVLDQLEMLSEDTSVPRNIRRGARESKDRLVNPGEDLDVRTASAIFTLEDLANDPNIPPHGRTLIWQILSQLETIK